MATHSGACYTTGRLTAAPQLQFRSSIKALQKGKRLRLLVGTLVLAAGLSAQRANSPADPVRTVVGRLELVRYKAHIKGLLQFGDRMQGTERNRGAIAWLDKQLGS